MDLIKNHNANFAPMGSHIIRLSTAESENKVESAAGISTSPI